MKDKKTKKWYEKHGPLTLSIYRLVFMVFFVVVGAFVFTGRIENPFDIEQVTGLVLMSLGLLFSLCLRSSINDDEQEGTGTNETK